MKKLHLLIAFVLCLSIKFLSAQRYSEFKFSEELPTLDSVHLSYDEIRLDYKYSLEFQVTSQMEVQYTFIYSKLMVNSDESIESNNKIYLSANNSDILYQIARVVNPDGKVINLDEKDVKEGVYEDDGQEYKYLYYALDGLEKGSIIEHATYQRQRPGYYGRLTYLQGDEYRLKQEFELIAPGHLVFDFKPVNGDFEVVYDTTEQVDNRWSVELDSVDRVLDQGLFYDDVVKKGVLYKLTRNVANNRSDITNYSNIKDVLYNQVHVELSKAQSKKIAKMVKEVGLDGKSEIDQIYAIENYVKTNFQFIESSASELNDMDFILENKAASLVGSNALMASFLDQVGIDFQLVLGCDRSNVRFDPEFEAYLFLDEYLFYFPKHDLYISPRNQYGRGKYVPKHYTENYAYYIKTMKVGEMKTVIGKIDFVPALSYKDNYDKMNIEVDFTEDIQMPEVSIRKEQMGYTATYIQPFYYLMDEDAISNFKKSIPSIVHESIVTDNVEFENAELNDYGHKPFIIKFTTNEHAFVGQAGKNYLFKIGELIGEQAEMYQETARQFPVESDNNRSYYREIKFTVPEGYTVKNLEKLNFVKGNGEKGEATMYFSSEVTQNGNEYTVISEEYYNDIIVPVEEFDTYVEVINAAADFNKIVLILEKN